MYTLRRNKDSIKKFSKCVGQQQDEEIELEAHSSVSNDHHSLIKGEGVDPETNTEYVVRRSRKDAAGASNVPQAAGDWIIDYPELFRCYFSL